MLPNPPIYLAMLFADMIHHQEWEPAEALIVLTQKYYYTDKDLIDLMRSKLRLFQAAEQADKVGAQTSKGGDA